MEHTALSFLPSPSAPRLPHFQTLLIQGDYPPSSPFHLCLSHLSCSNDSQLKSRPILITAKNRLRIIEGLVELNDDWLITNAGLGTTADLLSRIRIFYPSSPDHWAFLFSLLQTRVSVDVESASSNPNIHLDPPVSLVILHEPSAYFLDNDPPKSFTVYSYLRLITSALASLRSLNTDTGCARPTSPTKLRLTAPDRPPLVVFDSRLQELTLPILPMAITDPIVGEDDVKTGPGHRHNKVVLAVEKYFDWTGRVEVCKADSQQPKSDPGYGNTYRMFLSPSEFSSYTLPSPLIWHWRKSWTPGQKDILPRTVFEWDIPTSEHSA